MRDDDVTRPDPARTDEVPASSAPRVLAIKRNGSVWRMGKREFLKTAVWGAVAGATGACADRQDEEGDDAIPPFLVGGITYRVIALRDYNAVLPQSGKNVSVVAYVDSDFYFRHFDGDGQLAVNLHESKVTDKAALGEMKQLTQFVAAKFSADPTEQARFAELFSATTGSGTSTTASGRRMQGSQAETQTAGRRMQGSASTGTVSGRRMQGAEGRVESTSPPRNLGTLRVNNQSYENATILETYTDGYTRVSHAGGAVVVRTDALPEMVQLQLPQAVANPNPVPSAVPKTGVTRPAPSTPRRRRSTGHYWRPN